jgi:NCAIR mutase (PurE)-related protein
MHEALLRRLLEDVRAGTVSTDAALERLRALPFEDLGFARVDNHRSLRTGFPEVIFCQGKTAEQIARIAERIATSGHNVLATRAWPEAFEAVRALLPDAEYHPQARSITVRRVPVQPLTGLVLVITAGTSDIPVAEEAALTAELAGCPVARLYDVGVAGIHRLLYNTSLLWDANVVIVVAGMEGALPSVVAGLVDRPVIAVPASVGYGASFQGLAPLLTMLNSCAAGIAVVNIDNGFGAGMLAAMINRMCEEGPRRPVAHQARPSDATAG